MIVHRGDPDDCGFGLGLDASNPWRFGIYLCPDLCFPFYTAVTPAMSRKLSMSHARLYRRGSPSLTS